MADYRALQNGSDIRGVALEGIPGEPVNLTAAAAADLAAAFGVWLSQRLDKPLEQLTVSIGRDSRLSGPALAQAAATGLLEEGVQVIDCAMASTPAMFMSTVLEGHRYDGAIMITASHLPFNRNGLKFFTAQGGLEKEDIKAIIALCAQPRKTGGRGVLRPANLIDDYAAYLAEKIRRGIQDPDHYDQPLLGFKIAVDAGNGAGGFFAGKVLAPLGADVSASRYLEPDGRFPNHIPNPEDPAAMASITQAVVENGCDLGLIFDTDVDRAGAVDGDGEELNRNRLIALMAAIVLEEDPGATIVTDSVTSSQLADFITRELGGVHHRFKRGYRNVINEAIRLNREGTSAPLAMETSGHGALRENYFLDDGAYLCVKLLIQAARLRRQGKTLSSLVEKLGEPAEAKELRLPIEGEEFAAYGQQVLEGLRDYAAGQEGWQLAPDNHEGLRYSFDREGLRGWFLLRLSLHDPLMPLNIEADTPGGAKAIARMLQGYLDGCSRLNCRVLDDFCRS